MTPEKVVIGNAELWHGNCLVSLRQMADCSVDAIVTDPPYGLSFMGKRWDYDVPSIEVWAECLRVLKPGGHLLAFAGTRTQHRMAVRIEDAGFEIRDMIAWVYGSGFPKSLDVSKALAKNVYVQNRDLQDLESEAEKYKGWGTALKPALEPITVARKPLATAATNVLRNVESELRGSGVRGEILWRPESASGAAKKSSRTNSLSTEAQQAAATSAGNAAASVTPNGDQLSPKSSEQLGTSGLRQTRAASESFQGCTTSGCGNQSSAPTGGSAHAAESVSETFSPSTTSTAEEPSTANRFTGRCTPNCDETASRPDTESFAGIATGLTGSMETVRIRRDSEGFFLWPKGLPEFVPGSPLTVAENVLAHGTGALNIDGCRVPTEEAIAAHKMTTGGHGRTTGRFNETYSSGDGGKYLSTVGRWPANLIHDGSDEVQAGFPGEADGSAARFFYCAKASRSDRDDGLDSFEKQVVNVTQGQGRGAINTSKGGDGVRENRPRANTHPTVKPTDLMRYLCRLVTPPSGVVLDPFMGSGSTGKAAMLEGFRFIGCELSAEYLAIAQARITAAQDQRGEDAQDPAQLGLL